MSHTGPWVPNGDPMALQFVLERQQKERENLAAQAQRDAVRQELESSGEIEDFIQGKIDERMSAVKVEDVTEDVVNNG